MLLLGATDIRALLPMGEAVTAVANAFRALADGQAIQPQAQTVPLPDDSGRLTLKVGMLLADGSMSAKLNTLMPRAAQEVGRSLISGVIVLYELESGSILAILDSGTVTMMRTGAVTGAATDVLARADAAVAVVIGAGAHAADQVAALCEVRAIREVRVSSRHEDRGRGFCSSLAKRFGVRAWWSDNPKAVLEGADICVTVTTSSEPVVQGAWLPAGIHVNAVGAYQRDMRELDSEAVYRARVVVDSLAHCLAECGEFRIAGAERSVNPSRLVHAELGQILTRTRAGRTNEEQITLFKSVGLGIQDTAVAATAYRLAREAGRGADVTLE